MVALSAVLRRRLFRQLISSRKNSQSSLFHPVGAFAGGKASSWGKRKRRIPMCLSVIFCCFQADFTQFLTI